MTKESFFDHRQLSVTVDFPVAANPVPTPGGTAAARLARFERLVRQYEAVVFAVCQVLTNDDHQAGRCSEEAFVDAFQAGADMTLTQAEFLRETMRLALQRTGQAGPRLSLPLPVPGMEARWSKLSEDDRHILALRFAGRLEMSEMSDILGLPGIAVRARLWAAMQRLGGGLLGTN